jgi:hypothetical protein
MRNVLDRKQDLQAKQLGPLKSDSYDDILNANSRIDMPFKRI